MIKNVPIVFCHGLLGWKNELPKGFHYFVAAQKLKRQEQENIQPFILSSTGPFSSLHDQVCELFFQLKGGLTDYGEEHSKNAGHKRYARYYGQKENTPENASGFGGKAEYPEWDSEHPLDFVGHSMGGTLIRVLQKYLDEDYFYKNCGFSEHTNANWVRSVTTIAGVHNGSTLTWILGADEETGLLPQNSHLVKFLAKFLIRGGKHQNEKADKNFKYDLHLDQWENGQIDIYGSDWALYDLTPNAFCKFNSETKEFPDTWYFSCKAKGSFSIFGNFYSPIPFVTHLMLFINCFAMGFYRTKCSKWKSIEKLFRQNDGMCPTESEKYPFLGRNLNESKNFKNSSNIDLSDKEKGKWNVITNVPLMDHAEPAMFPHLLRIHHSKKIYKKLIDILKKLSS